MCRGKGPKRPDGRPGGGRGGNPTRHLANVLGGGLCRHPARVQARIVGSKGQVRIAGTSRSHSRCSAAPQLRQVFLFELQRFCGAREKPEAMGLGLNSVKRFG